MAEQYICEPSKSNKCSYSKTSDIDRISADKGSLIDKINRLEYENDILKLENKYLRDILKDDKSTITKDVNVNTNNKTYNNNVTIEINNYAQSLTEEEWSHILREEVINTFNNIGDYITNGKLEEGSDKINKIIH